MQSVWSTELEGEHHSKSTTYLRACLKTQFPIKQITNQPRILGTRTQLDQLALEQNRADKVQANKPSQLCNSKPKLERAKLKKQQQDSNSTHNTNQTIRHTSNKQTNVVSLAQSKAKKTEKKKSKKPQKKNKLKRPIKRERELTTNSCREQLLEFIFPSFKIFSSGFHFPIDTYSR